MAEVVELVVTSGEISETVAKAVTAAHRKEGEVHFRFNGIDIRVAGDSKAGVIVRDYHRALRGCIPEVGPHPPEELSREVQARDAAIIAERDREWEAQMAELRERNQVTREEVTRRLEDAPDIEVMDREGWAGACSDVHLMIVDFATRWARMMQVELADGKDLADVAEPLIDDVNFQGVSGDGISQGVVLLANHWRHGSELAEWYNLDVGHGSLGEQANQAGVILNPASIELNPDYLGL